MKVPNGVRIWSLGFGMEGFEFKGVGFRVLGLGVNFLRVGSPSTLYHRAKAACP